MVFEHGLLIGKLGRGKVIPLVVDHNIELQGISAGMVYMLIMVGSLGKRLNRLVMI